MGFQVGSAETDALHFMWLKEQSSSQALAAEREEGDPVLRAEMSRVLTPGSTASGEGGAVSWWGWSGWGGGGRTFRFEED